MLNGRAMNKDHFQCWTRSRSDSHVTCPCCQATTFKSLLRLTIATAKAQKLTRWLVQSGTTFLSLAITREQLELWWFLVFCKATHESLNCLWPGYAWIKEGLWQLEGDFFSAGLFFSSLSGTLRSTTLKHYGHLCPDKRTSSQFGH